ncbi:HAAS signaling domain-containing protein [Pedobacter sp.]|jgi:uncharacterized membrane protein|uniref:HAAS signaling domain-containing protein n=1 Tax=Pedobacter sp. TaxID=1411316 RepID=UPI002B8F599D|nr:DUF1700 domain-containing protein [Pedobacter sp.]HWW38569.1 DUF1700 domain-containing protein [Pedobacter sp.]
MNLTKIPFTDKSSIRIYQEYLDRIQRATKSLSKEDQLEIMMELNSHIYENFSQKRSDNEIEQLLDILQKLGSPEEVLKPLVADKKLTQATRTFNPIHIFKALILNIGNGLSYIIFFLLYLCLFAFIFLIGAKTFMPDRVGLFYKKGSTFILGMSSNYPGHEILGNWFIPVMIVLTIVLYLLLTFLLKIKNRFHHKH